VSTPARIVVIGEALVDVIVAADGTSTTTEGGAPYNVARTIGRLGAPVAFAGALSTDVRGRRLLGRLLADGVMVDLVLEVDAPTTEAIALLDERAVASYRFSVEGTSAPLLSAVPGIGPHDMVVTGGLALVLEPMATVVEGIAAARRTGGAMVVLDVNSRPRVIADPEAYRHRVHRICAHSDVVKVSDEDLAVLAAGVDPLQAAEALLGLGPAVVVLTRGAQGVAVFTPSGSMVVEVPEVEVLDTIGAGDAFTGAFAAWWWLTGRTREDLADLTALGCAVGAAVEVAGITCERRGADPPRRTELSASWV